jgi:hypothetical protein
MKSSNDIKKIFPQPILDDIWNYRYAVNLEQMKRVEEESSESSQ